MAHSLRCGISIRSMCALGQILPPRDVRGMSVIPPKAAVNADIFVRNWSRVPLSGRYESAGEVSAPERLVRTFGGPRTVQPRLRLPGLQIATSWSLWAEE
jgi:hypothetical protein